MLLDGFLVCRKNGKLMETKKSTLLVTPGIPFEDTQQAMEYSESGRAKGKIIIKIK
ncbi:MULTISPECIES: zinc-binding dehydrogenase [Gracilibacillus]|uniref:zinc-binding dehydrogenase n=1 Tax=Gracilibacillus TaxID=74385 RepID=UPI0021CBD0CC|nr:MULTISPECIES: zinc-binding dehydrogenase [Gracilibacillus]